MSAQIIDFSAKRRRRRRVVVTCRGNPQPGTPYCHHLQRLWLESAADLKFERQQNGGLKRSRNHWKRKYAVLAERDRLDGEVRS